MISIIIPKYYNRLSQHFLVCSASYTSPQVYKQFSLFSPSHLSPLSERLRDRVLVLVGKSYSVIRLDDLCSLLGLSTDQTRHCELFSSALISGKKSLSSNLPGVCTRTIFGERARAVKFLHSHVF